MLVCGAAAYFYYFGGVGGQIAYEIDKLNLPVDSTEVDYESKTLSLLNFDARNLLFSEQYLQNKPEANPHIQIGEISMTDVDWWYLYQEEILVVDTLLIENFYASLNEKHIEEISYKSELPIKKIKAKVLIVQGDSLSYLHANSTKASCGQFRLLKSNVELRLSDLNIEDILSDIHFTANNSTLSSSEQELNCFVDSLLYTNKNLDLSGAVLYGQGMELKESKIHVEFDPMKILQAREPITIGKLSIESKGIIVGEAFDIEKLSNFSNKSIKSIAEFQIKSAKVDYQGKGVGKKQTFNASDLQFSKSNVDLIKLDNNFKGLSFSIRNLELQSEINELTLEADHLNYSGDHMSFGNGAFKQLKNGGVQFSFDELDLFGLELEELSDKKLDLDSIYIDVSNAKVGENLVEEWTESINFPFEDIRIGVLNIDGNDLEVDMAKREDINIARFISKIIEVGKSESSEIKFDSYDVQLVNVTTASTDRSLAFKSGGISIQDGQMKLSNIKIDPWKSSKSSGNTIYKISVPSIILSLSDLQSYLQNEKLEFDKLLVEDLNMEITTDENVSKNGDYKESLPEMLLHLKVPINIAQIDIKRADFKFLYRPKDDESFSQIYFNDMDLTISNLCNQKAKLQENSILAIIGKADFMGKTDFEIDAKFDLLDPKYAYEYKLELGSMDFSEVNEMLTDLAGLKIKKGKLDKLLCNVRADKFESIGTLDFYYRNLNVRFDKKKFIEQWNPVNFMITRFILNKDNREEWEHETGLINVKRDGSRTMYFQMWDAVFDGMKYVMKPEI